MSERLTPAQVERLRQISGDRSARLPRSRWHGELTTRALIDRGLVNPNDWTLTDAGRAALEKANGR